MPTMRNEAKRVAAKREVVERDRGCKCGVITVCSNGKILLHKRSWHIVRGTKEIIK
jgi:hypothetical protein